MLQPATLFATAVAVEVLREYIARMADVHVVPMRGKAARLDTTGERPALWLNSTSSVQDQARALMDAIHILVLGAPPERVHQVRRLHSVS